VRGGASGRSGKEAGPLVSHLAIRLLGSFQVAVAGQGSGAFRSDKLGALLAYLVVEAAQPHRRAALVELLWPNMATPAGLTDLRQALYRLRRHLGDDGSRAPYLLVTPDDVQFNQAADYWLDVTEFQAQIGVVRAHHPGDDLLCDDCVGVLESAIKLYRGAF
jgi:DNA-binding SARP family transcriptional activator